MWKLFFQYIDSYFLNVLYYDEYSEVKVVVVNVFIYWYQELIDLVV